jgi:hypothetical protein
VVLTGQKSPYYKNVVGRTADQLFCKFLWVLTYDTSVLMGSSPNNPARR